MKHQEDIKKYSKALSRMLIEPLVMVIEEKMTQIVKELFINFNSEKKMENQHRQIKGYRELGQEEIDLMNEVKTKGVELGALVEKLKALESTDKRWVSIGATDLQTGLMALTRSIAKPEFF